MRPWVILRFPLELSDLDRASGVTSTPPEWYECFQVGEMGGYGAQEVSMLQKLLAHEGLVPVRPSPDDHESVIEWWVPLAS